MAQIVNMPKEGITVESCLVGAWRKDIGDSVAVGDVLLEYETDKAVFECLSTAEGVLLHKFYESGDEAPVLTPVAIVGETGENVSALISDAVTGFVDAEPEHDGGETAGIGSLRSVRNDDMRDTFEEGRDKAPLPCESERIKISPRARSFAAEHGIDPSTATPTGPGWRILEADVIAVSDKLQEVQPEAEDPEVTESEHPPAQEYDEPQKEEAQRLEMEALYTDERFSQIRMVIAKTMMASLQNGAQLTNHHSFDATCILAMREDFKTSDETLGYRNVSVGDIILYVASRILAKHPEINALVAETGLRKYYTVNLGVAVETPRGLMVPTVFGAEKKSLREISGEVKELAAAAREGRISPDKLAGGTFTISNLGATGVEVFTPIINPPQVAIAGITGIIERVRKGKGGRVEVYPSIGVSLTYDHRAIDGAPASRFAAELCDALAAFSWKTLALENDNEQRL